MSSHKRKFARKHRLREPHRILDETGLLEGREVIVHETAPGMRKMSETLLEFLEPYRELADTDEATERLIALGALAWNLALRPADERKRELRELAATVFRDDSSVATQQPRPTATPVPRGKRDRKQKTAESAGTAAPKGRGGTRSASKRTSARSAAAGRPPEVDAKRRPSKRGALRPPEP